jgi:riboflavin kinase
MLDSITFEGTLFTGEGNGKKYLGLLWVKQQIEEKLGFTPYLGTLNLKLTKTSTQRKRFLEKEKAVRICPAEGYCPGFLFRACIKGGDCAVVLPEVKGYPENVLEIISPLNLRETFNLKDGDELIVSVQI